MKIQPLDEAARERALRYLDGLTKPQGSLGRLEELGAHLAAVTGQVPPPLPRKAAVVMAADHGVVEEGVTSYPSEVTALMVRNFLEGGAAINVLARQAGAEVLCVDVGVKGEIETPKDRHPAVRFKAARIRPGTANFVEGPAMTPDEALAAFEVGAHLAGELAAEGFGLLSAGEMGIGNTTASTAVIALLTGESPDEIVGPGAGLDAQGLERKRTAIRRGITRNRPDPADPLDVLHKLGGLEIAALAGLMVGAARRRLPVVVDGVISGAAALVAEGLAPGTRQYLIAGHLSAEPGHRAALRHLGLTPYLDLSLRLGEGTGAVLAFHLVDAAVRIMAEMATLASLGIAPTKD